MAEVVGVFFFFFQAEDGIRDGRVTGVQTCALPIVDFRPPGSCTKTKKRDRPENSKTCCLATGSEPFPLIRTQGPRGSNRSGGRKARSEWVGSYSWGKTPEATASA